MAVKLCKTNYKTHYDIPLEKLGFYDAQCYQKRLPDGTPRKAVKLDLYKYNLMRKKIEQAFELTKGEFAMTPWMARNLFVFKVHVIGRFAFPGLFPEPNMADDAYYGNTSLCELSYSVERRMFQAWYQPIEGCDGLSDDSHIRAQQSRILIRDFLRSDPRLR